MSDTPTVRGPGEPLKDAMRTAARAKIQAPRAARWLWLAVGVVAVVVAVGQIAGFWESPVARKVREEKERRGEIPARVAATFDVVVTRAGDRVEEAAAVVAHALGLPPGEARALLARVPATVRAGLPEEAARRLAERLSSAGARAEVRAHAP